MKRSSPSRNSRELVRRAASTGGAVDSLQHQSRLRFLGFVASIVAAGTFMVGFAWSARQYDHPTLFDSWENAYGVFDCTAEAWLEPIESTNNPNGIRTRNDGVIYIEPRVEAVTGDGARLDVFLNNVGASMSDTTLTLPGGQVLSEQGAVCDGQEAVLQVQRWRSSSLTEPVEIITADFDNIVFLEDGQAFAIALAPFGANVPAPPSSVLVRSTLQTAQLVNDGTTGSS